MTMTAVAPIKPGRPIKNAQRKYHEGKLYPLLASKLPHHVDTSRRLNVASLAKAISVSGQTLYSSMGMDKLSPRVAGLIVAESRGQLTRKDLADFIIA